MLLYQDNTNMLTPLNWLRFKGFFGLWYGGLFWGYYFGFTGYFRAYFFPDKHAETIRYKNSEPK